MANDLAAWRASRRTTMTLPASNLTVTLKRVAVEDLAARGSIPTPLYGQVQALMAAGAGGAAPALDFARFPDYVALIDLVASAALVEPAVAEVADETHITIDELPLGDRIVIFNWAQGVPAALVTFPGDPAGPGAGATPGGDELPRAPKRTLARAS
jgi:hypothetical protein